MTTLELTCNLRLGVSELISVCLSVCVGRPGSTFFQPAGCVVTSPPGVAT